MSASTSGTKSSGVGFPTLLGLLFIGLKLGHVIGWSWLWVLAPFWLPLAVVLAIWLIIVVVVLLVKVLAAAVKAL